MKTAKTNRRNFLLAAGLGGTGAAAAVVTAASKTKAAMPGAAPATGEASGYRVSEHILKYYKTTEV